MGVTEPIAVASVRSHFIRGLIPILTWRGRRGGILVAMVLSLPRFEARDLLVMCAFSVVVFLILAQSLTVRSLLAHFGVGEPA